MPRLHAYDEAHKTIQALQAHYRELGHFIPLPEIQSTQARLSLNQGDFATASRWAQTVNPDDLNESAFVFEVQFLTWAGVRIAQGASASLQAATDHLQKRLIEEKNRHHTRRMIQILALLATAYEKQGRTEKALETQERAVGLAQPGGFVRTFLDLDPAMAKLLGQLTARYVLPKYIGRILAGFDAMTKDDGQETAPPSASMIEPLTPRELEVLNLLSAYLTYDAIAESLVISPRTVKKKHVSNIYQKLGVQKRKEAIEEAEALGILSSE